VGESARLLFSVPLSVSLDVRFVELRSNDADWKVGRKEDEGGRFVLCADFGRGRVWFSD